VPEIVDEQYGLLITDCMKNFIPVNLNISDDEKEKALKTCNEYLNNGNINVDDLCPQSVYYIISKLPEDKQIEFFRENINYIKKNDEDIFLYHMLSPKSLAYYLSLKVIKEIKALDDDLVQKIINGNGENLFHGFSHEDYIEFYNDFYDDILKMDNMQFISNLYFCNRCYYDNNHSIDNLNDIYKLQLIYNKKLIEYLLKKYQDKISTFSPKEMLRFIKYIGDIDIYKLVINENYDKLNEGFRDIEEYALNDYLSETNNQNQEILIYTFFDNIIKKQDIKKIIFKIDPRVVIELYNKNKEVFDKMNLADWIKYCASTKDFNEDFKNILNTFVINDIESLFDNDFFYNVFYKKDIRALRYIENKYRENIKIDGILEDIDENTSIFSKKYFKNMKELREKLKNNDITKNDECYKKLLTNFILFFKNENIINNIEGNKFKELDKLFYRIVMGETIALVYQLPSIEEITLFNRIGHVDFDVRYFTVEQLEKYNVKHHKQLYTKYEAEGIYFINMYKKLTLKLFLMIGFKHAKSLLEIDDSIFTLEHLVGYVDVKNVVLDSQGNPILNNKLMNLLFSDKDYSKIKRMLSDKNNDLYKYFPRIFNEWEMIKINDKDKTLNTIINFLKSDEILVPPQYYRLVGLFKYIGCSNSIVNETLALHDQILARTESTIPRVVGTKDGYSYEILRLDDMEGLTVGNKTDCCFTVLGNGYSCLKHALTNKNGRILAITNNDKLLAHSWLWRNGDLLCLDNIEISKAINQVDFFEVYLQLFDEILKMSFESEGIDNCIKNITIGFTNFDKKINGIENYPCLISKKCNLIAHNFKDRLGPNRVFIDALPQPLENVEYTDSKNVQYLIRGNGKFNLGPVFNNYKDEDLEEDKCKDNSKVLKKQKN